MTGKTQWERLCEYDTYELLWATVKCDELMQEILQNFILVERGRVPKFITECNQIDFVLYKKRKNWLFKHDLVSEDDLRKSVIDLLNRNK